MFGHLRISRCRLGENDRSLYSSHFCSVCHNLHAFAGRDATLLTNYDVTLWSLVASGVSARDYAGTAPARPCTALPFRRVAVQTLTPETGASLAALTVLLAWAKLEDHRQDGGALLGRLGQLWLGGKEKKARDYLARRGYPLASLLELPALQAAAEKREAPDLDTLCRPTSQALSDAFAWIASLSARPDLVPPLRSLGQGLARFVYLWDALEDLEKDRRSGAFNAIRAVWGKRFGAGSVRGELSRSLDGVAQALDRLPLGNRRKLCLELVESLRGSLAGHPALRQESVPAPGPRRRMAVAGFVRPSDCDCDCDCGDSCCCDCGGGDHSCCGGSGCDGGDSARLLSCCDWLDCCSGCDCCCCYGDDDGPDREKKKTSRGGCCGSGGKAARDGRASSPVEARAEVEEEELLCPGCRHDLPDLGMAARVCQHCAGAWLESGADSEILEGMRRPSVSSPPPIPRAGRTCPRCRTLLRTPIEGAQSCDKCLGSFHEPVI